MIYECLYILYLEVVYKRIYRDILLLCIINIRNLYVYIYIVYIKILVCRYININNFKLVCRK